jgi:hypothetical protein
MLQGAHLYVDWIENNPPSMTFFSMAVEWLAQQLRISDLWLFKAAVFALAMLGLGSLVKSFKTRKNIGIYVNLMSLIWILTYWPGFAVSARAFDFGQREHILTLLLAPYILWRWTEGIENLVIPQSRVFLLLLGYFSMIKPQFPILIAGLEWLAIRRRGYVFGKERATLWIFIGMLMPFLLLLAHSGESFVGFFRTMIPTHRYYRELNADLEQFLMSRTNLWLLLSSVATAVLAFYSVRRRRQFRFAFQSLAIILPVNYFGILFQMKFFSYHMLPVFGVNILLLVFLLSGQMKNLWFKRLLSGGLIVLAFFGIHFFDANIVRQPIQEDVLMDPLFTSKDRILYLSLTPEHIEAALKRDLNLLGPWIHYYTIPGISKIPDSELRQGEVINLRTGFENQIRESKPDFIIFNGTHWKLYNSLFVVLTENWKFEIPMDYERVPEASFGKIENAVVFRRRQESPIRQKSI